MWYSNKLNSSLMCAPILSHCNFSLHKSRAWEMVIPSTWELLQCNLAPMISTSSSKPSSVEANYAQRYGFSSVWDPLGEIGTHLLYIATGHLKIHHKVLHNSSVSMVSLGSDACRIERLPGDGTNKCAMSATTVYPLGGTVIGFTPAIPCSLTNLS